MSQDYSGGDSDSSEEDKNKKGFINLHKQYSVMASNRLQTTYKPTKQGTINFTEKTRIFRQIM